LASLYTASASIPAALAPHPYLEPEVLALEDERIFSRTWQFAGHISQLPEPGTYLTANAGTQPVLVLRDDEGELRAFRNVCRHRGSRLLSGSGECKKAIRCRYHGWTYRMDGQLIGVPEGRQIPGLDKSALGLFPARVEVMSGLVFVNLDIHATPLAEQVAGLPERLAPYGFENLKPKVEKETSHPANWKIVVDNYLEGYHVPIAHPGLMRLYDYKNYDVELFDHWAWFNAPLRDKPSANFLERTYQRMVEPMPGLGPEHTRVWHYILIYPNTTIDLYPDQIGIWQVLPKGVDATHDVAMTLLPHRSSVRTRAAQFANRKVNKLVSDEDVDLVANQQAGIATHGFEPGPLSRREAAVGWFAERIRADLGEDR
jgi:phenylpropionate dioxygenase-like ring-hydroxylating dioxygenase large terminal subunit